MSKKGGQRPGRKNRGQAGDVSRLPSVRVPIYEVCVCAKNCALPQSISKIASEDSDVRCLLPDHKELGSLDGRLPTRGGGEQCEDGKKRVTGVITKKKTVDRQHAFHGVSKLLIHARSSTFRDIMCVVF